MKLGSPEKALLYARVSDKSQKLNGSGLESQAHRCLQHAKEKGYVVEKIFEDDYTGAGDFMNRPGMVQLLKYLEDHPLDKFVICFDDLKRFARDTFFHLKLRETLRSYGARIECMNYVFDETPEGEFVETVFAAQGQLERRQNARQTKQKMAAACEVGAWPFKPPVGYTRIKRKGQRKLIVKDEPLASIVRQAIEGFATGRYPTQMDVKLYLEKCPEFPKSNGYVHLQRVKEMLTRRIYTGYIEYPEWGISLRKGLHEPIISTSTYEKVQKRLNEQANLYVRRVEREDFPVRGCVYCGHCGMALTAYWAAGRNKKYAYYECKNRQCTEAYGQSIRKELLESEFEGLLQGLLPKKEVILVGIKMLKKHWAHYGEFQVARAKALKAQIAQCEKKIDAIAARIVDTENPAVIKALEKQLQSMETKKIVCSEQIEEAKKPRGTFDDSFRTAIALLQNPHKWFVSKGFLDRRIAVKLIFDGKLEWVRDIGFRTAKLSLPVSELTSYFGGQNSVLENGGPTRT